MGIPIFLVVSLIVLAYAFLFLWPMLMVGWIGYHHIHRQVRRWDFQKINDLVSAAKKITSSFMKIIFTQHGGTSPNLARVESDARKASRTKILTSEIVSRIDQNFHYREANMFGVTMKRDRQIEQDVINELLWEPRLNSSAIRVASKDGIVTLNGSVSHYMEKKVAEGVAQRVGGVMAVADEITVEMMGSYDRSDEDIARAALNALEWNYYVPKEGLQVTVEKGWITLSGETDWDFQRNAAKDAIASLMGVIGVNNLIRIKSKFQSPNVKALIEESLRRSTETEGRDIHVLVIGSTVTLSGQVHSMVEMEEASHAAWNAPGVSYVENNLTLTH